MPALSTAGRLVIAALTTVPVPLLGQALETETARTLHSGEFVLGSNFEYQFSAEGHESALPGSLELGLTNRLEFLIEPVAYTAIRPKVGPRATGFGDLEATVTYLLLRETPGRPAVAVASEVKFPTAGNRLIGTGKTDVAGYLILSKQFGRLDTHANLDYTVVGKPKGLDVRNVFNAALAGEYRLGSRAELYSEVLVTTSAAASGSGDGGSGASAEIGGTELVGSIGLGYNLTSALFLSAGVSQDNNNATLLRSGFTLRFH